MRVLIQRVLEAKVTIDTCTKSEIGAGLLILLGIESADDEEDIDYLTSKIVHLRIFDVDNGVMNCSVLENDGEILAVSQFTLFASTHKGNRPSYIRAAKADIAVPLYEKFCRKLEEKLGKNVKTGTFGADMQISLVNDGPVTIWIDSKEKKM
jgi:D-tyrosyl-tRNA(Tyr) deacylase